MDIYHNLIEGCKICDLFLNHDKILEKNLIYPETKEQLKSVDFMVVKYNGDDLFIVRDHVPSISKELWGKIFFNCKQMYGYKSKLVIINSKHNHWYAKVDKGD